MHTFGGAQGCSERTPSLAAEMGEVEQRELRLTERNKVLQMDVINFGSNIRVEWSCPECKNKNEIGLPALFYAIQRRYMVECAACGDSFYVSANVSDRAAELPLEPTAPI